MPGWSPVSGAVHVTSGQTSFQIEAQFSQPLDPASVNISSFLLRLSGSSTNLSGDAYLDTGDTTTAIFVPSSGIFDAQTPSTSASYIPIILGSGNAVGVQNLEGFFAATVSGSFKTATIVVPPDTTPPVVSGQTPASGSTGYALSGRPTVTFSEQMLSGKMSGQVKVRVSGAGSDTTASLTVASDKITVTVVPTAYLSGNTVYRGHVNTGVQDLAGNALAASYVWSFTTVNPSAPTVSGTSPVSGATGFAVSGTPTITFSTQILSGTMSGQIKIRVSGSSTDVSGTVALSSNNIIVKITPNVMLSHCTVYRGFVHNTIQDILGVTPMAASYLWSFTTFCPTAPTVSGTTPVSGATGYEVSGSPVIVFSTAIQSGSMSGAIKLRVSGGGTDVPAAVSISSNLTTVMINPTADLSHCTVYRGFVHNTVKEQLGVTSMAASYLWSFTTTCPTAPAVSGTSPVSGATGVSRTVSPVVTFDREIASSTVSTTSFKMQISGGAFVDLTSVTLSSNLLAVEIDPTPTLAYSTVFNSFISNTVKEVLGVTSMAASYSWNFTTVDPSYTSIYNVTRTGTDDHNLDTDKFRIGFRVQGGSPLIGEIPVKISVKLREVGSVVSGIVKVRIRDSSENLVQELGEIPTVDLSSSTITYTLVNLSASYALVQNDKVLVEFDSGSSTDKIAVAINSTNANTGTIYTQFIGTSPSTAIYEEYTNEELAATIYELS